MSTMLYALGVGMMFILGMLIGCFIARAIIAANTKKTTAETIAMNNRIEDRLAKYVEHSDRIATALETLVIKSK